MDSFIRYELELIDSEGDAIEGFGIYFKGTFDQAAFLPDGVQLDGKTYFIDEATRSATDRVVYYVDPT